MSPVAVKSPHFQPSMPQSMLSGSIVAIVTPMNADGALDSLELHRLALAENISIAPGPIFSPRREYRNCVRLNCGHAWTAGTERALQRLAQLAERLIT